MTQERDQLLRELDNLARENGTEVAARDCLVLAEVIRWLRERGHGDIKLSAVGHVLGSKFRVDSVVTARSTGGTARK